MLNIMLSICISSRQQKEMGKKSIDFSFRASPTVWARASKAQLLRKMRKMWSWQQRQELLLSGGSCSPGRSQPERLLPSCLLNSALLAEDGGGIEHKKARFGLAMTRRAGKIGITTWRVLSPMGAVPFLPD